MKQRLGSDESGFTVLELMIATIISAMLLTAGTAALVQVGRMFYKGVTTAHTQETVRTLIDEVSRPIQFSGAAVSPADGTPPPDATPRAICVGNQRYSYRLMQQVGAGEHALWRDTKAGGAACDPVTLTDSQPTLVGQSLVSEYMRLVKFSVVPIDTSNTRTWEVVVKVAYGNDDGTEDIFSNIGDPENIACRGAFIGAQFCAVSELSTAVTRRVGNIR